MPGKRSSLGVDFLKAFWGDLEMLGRLLEQCLQGTIEFGEAGVCQFLMRGDGSFVEALLPELVAQVEDFPAGVIPDRVIKEVGALGELAEFVQ